MPRRVRGADAAKKSNHFSDDMRVRKILIGRQCARRARAIGRNPPLAAKSSDFAPVFYFAVALQEQPAGPKKFSFLSLMRMVTSLLVMHSPSRQVTISGFSEWI